MKLQKIYIKKYKNLIEFTIDFRRGNGLSMLVGNNGSGKSNLLEAISGIFHDLFRSVKSERIIACDYSLEYELDGVNCKLEQIDGTLRCYGEKFKRREQFIDENAPNNIIGLYSGEEDRLWTQFYEHYYKTYMRRIKENQYQGRMKLVFINKYYWNIALLTLLLSSNDTLKPFIENDLGIRTVDEVVLTYNFHNYEQANNLLKAFIDRINPEHKVRQKYSIDDLKQAIFYDFWATRNGEHIVDSNGTHILVNSGITDVDVFRFLTQGCMPKDSKVISNISIIMNGGITVQQLSEGEKKLILVKAVLEILADEKSLILMDEPDAHLHEGRKPALIDLMRDYPNRQIIVATHSPIIAQLASDEELLMIECSNGKATLMSDEKKEKIKRLTGSAWDIIGQEMIFKSSHPLVVFEGKTDVEYTKRAIELLKSTKPEYNTITVDFLNANGAGNIKSFLDNLFELITPSKKVIVFFDRDDAGKKGAAAVAEISKDDERIVHYQDIVNGNVVVSFIPYKEGITDGDFLIEDYFSWDGTLQAIMEQLIPDKKHPIKNLPNLSARIKSEIERRYMDLKPEEFKRICFFDRQNMQSSIIIKTDWLHQCTAY